MRTLYHYQLCPFCRIVRIFLKEKKLDHELIIEYPWDRKKTFAERHMLSDIPTLVEKDGAVLEGCYAIIEHLEQSNARIQSLLGSTIKERAETRRIISIFNTSFFADVTQRVVFEKMMKKYMDSASPDSACIRRGSAALRPYLDYIAWLVDRRNWLAGNEFSLADISAAAQISCLDYLGSIDWGAYPPVKEWYVRIKSRPSFRDILADKWPTIPPSPHYAELDY